MARTFRSFRYRNFRWLWFGAFTSTTGFFVAQIAESWYIYERTSSEGLLGLTAFLNGLPILLFSVVGGVLADRMDRRYLLIGSQVLQMTASLGLAFAFWSERIEVWHILAAAFLAGLGQAFGGPCISGTHAVAGAKTPLVERHRPAVDPVQPCRHVGPAHRRRRLQVPRTCDVLLGEMGRAFSPSSCPCCCCGFLRQPAALTRTCSAAFWKVSVPFG